MCIHIKKQQLEPVIEQKTGAKLRREYVRAVHCHCLFNLYAKYIMPNAGLDKSQAGIKIARRNINNLDVQVTPPYGRKLRGIDEPLDEGERRE